MQMDENSMIGGMLMGAGLREISQVLGLSKSKKSGLSQNGEQPPAQVMAQGQMGDIDKMLMLSKLQSLQGGGPPGPGGPVPMGPGGPLPGPMPPASSPPLAPPPGGMAAPLPQPGAPMPPGAAGPGPMPPGPPMGGGAPTPMAAALGGAAPGGPPQGNGLPMQLLAQLLQGSQGLV